MCNPVRDIFSKYPTGKVAAAPMTPRFALQIKNYVNAIFEKIFLVCYNHLEQKFDLKYSKKIN